ncbi:hypothetical protein HaLaN_09942 [Haematococcus lacustris]|uniref:Uncharacterized protein n=1 Tax=Haematococcus lacustris TaxID=44745 RepID=A0A699YWL6_HAELA|nr:hypothetical protein HaLaN_09942 [Haematococcus lacustris]
MTRHASYRPCSAYQLHPQLRSTFLDQKESSLESWAGGGSLHQPSGQQVATQRPAWPADHHGLGAAGKQVTPVG